MTIYAKTSESYWKAQRKKHVKKLRVHLTITMIGIFTVIAGAVIRRSRRSNATRPLAPRRAPDQTTEIDWKQCESRVNSQEECATICLPERNSIQRKTMHQACLHGCQQAHVASTALSCRGAASSEEDVFREIGGLAHVHCSKFQGIDPKPDVFATCRKYHRAGTKHGYRMGLDAMMHILDEEFQNQGNMLRVS
jgi:hypothetical protein